MIMPGTRPGKETFSDAEGRSTEMELRSHVVQRTVANGQSGGC